MQFTTADIIPAIGGLLLGFGLTQFGFMLAISARQNKWLGGTFGLASALGLIIVIETLG